MKLYLVQHGEAHTKDENPDRPLNVKGLADINRLATFIQKAGIHVERIIHSGKLRAKQTAERLAEAMAAGIDIEISSLINPGDNPKVFDLQRESWDKDSLVVGHLPFMAKLVSHLLTGDENLSISAFRPGTMVCLETDRDDQWQLNWMIRPELLK